MIDIPRIKKIIHFNQGQVGDLCINTVAARAYRGDFTYTDKMLLMSVNKKYVDILPLFYNHPHIDGFHVWDGYEQASEKDIIWLNNNFIDTVNNPMPKHSSDNWFENNHQAKECCIMNNVNFNRLDEDYSCYLEKWFDIPTFKSRNIAFAPFAGWYNKNNDKKLSVDKAQRIVDLLINREGFSVLQVGGKDEPKLNGVWKPETSYFDSMKNILGCELLITTDTWAAWYASAYKHKTIGLYSNKYYTKYGINYIKNIQPINSNAKYLDAENVNDIPTELIIDKIKEMI